jgi:hypothetical protein
MDGLVSADVGKLPQEIERGEDISNGFDSAAEVHGYDSITLYMFPSVMLIFTSRHQCVLSDGNVVQPIRAKR